MGWPLMCTVQLCEGDAHDGLEQAAFTHAVAAHQADGFAWRDRQVDAAQNRADTVIGVQILGLFMDEVAHLGDLSVDLNKPVVTIDKLRGHKEKVIGKLKGGLAAMAKMRKVSVVRGDGAFVGANHVEVEEATGDGQEKTGTKKVVAFKKCIIAAGSQAVHLPFMPKDPRVVDSTGALELKEVPDPQVYDLVLQAVGRTPNGKKIAADKAGVAVTDRGFINVGIQMRTNLPHIFAIGDIVGQPILAHEAVHEAHLAAEVIAGELQGNKELSEN